MTPRPSRADYLRRRSAAAAAAALLVLFVVAIVVNAVAGDDGDDAADAPLRAPAPTVEGVFNDPRVGVAVARPEGWTARRRRGAVRLAARGRNVIVSISSPARASQTDEVLDSAIAALREQYRDVEVSDGDGRRIAGRPTESAVVSATSSRGTPLRVLVAAVEGRRKAYLVQVFAAEGASERRLAEAQTVISSLRLGK